MNAPSGRNASVTVMVTAIAGMSVPNSLAMAGSVNTTTKKSNASSVQPRKLSSSAFTQSLTSSLTDIAGADSEVIRADSLCEHLGWKLIHVSVRRCGLSHGPGHRQRRHG